MAVYKPTAEEKRIIRDCAARGAGFKRVEINPSTKVNLNDQREHMNIAIVSDDPDWQDTDLADNAFTWKDFTKGVELTKDGRAIVDFYVYDCGRSSELQTNITAYIENGRLVRVEEVARGTMWKAT